VFHQSEIDTTTVTVKGIILPPHMFPDPDPITPPTQNVPAPFLVVNSGRSFELTPPTDGDNFDIGGSGNGYHIVRTDPVLTTASDGTVQIDVSLAALEASLGGDVAFVTARLANGDPLPDWLKFDPATGTFVGLPPGNAAANIEPAGSADNDAGPDGILPKSDRGIAGLNTPAQPNTITLEVTARDSKGNIAASVFTIDLRAHTASRQGWNLDRNTRPFGNEHHAWLPMLSPELAAIEAAVRDVTRSLEPFAMRDMLPRHGERSSAEAVPAGRAGLTEQLASIGWRSMAAQRNALLASLQHGR
jgi:hypothetical protein